MFLGKRARIYASDLGVLESKLESKLSSHPILDRPILNQQSNVLFDWIVLKWRKQSNNHNIKYNNINITKGLFDSLHPTVFANV